MTDLIVIGGGAAGLMCAYAAADAGASVLLLERNEKLGKKIYITGKGRCNLTNACEPDAFLKSVVRSPRFLYAALRALPPRELMALMERLGLPTVVERGDRVFPESQKASDVTRTLERALARLGVQIRLNARVSGLRIADGRVAGVTLEGGESLPARAVAVCTGGVSYPSTGSTGDGYRLLEQAGHEIVPPVASLVPLTCGADWVTGLQGLSLRNVRLTLTRGKRTLYTEGGEMLFTHFGISGPLVLSASAYLADQPLAECALSLDLKPGLTERQLEARLLRDLGAAGKKQALTVLCALYPARLAQTMAALCGIDPQKPACELRREERAALVRATKALPLPVTGPRGMSEAVVTCGGARVNGFIPSTLESKLVPGLYAAGETLDIDALTGGFNLHIAFATGYLAGRGAAHELQNT